MEYQIKDASSFFLWEESADSEVDRLLLSHPQELESAVDDQEEDACSCSCDDYASNTRALDFQDDGEDDGDLAVGLIDDGRSDQLDGRWRRRSTGEALEYNYEEEEEDEDEEASSNNVSVIRDMNEMEDKVFWDTCMAGGYP